MRRVLASTIAAVIIVLSLLNLSTLFLQKDTMVFPVEDGGVIIDSRTNEGLFHLSPLNMKFAQEESIDTIREGIQNISAINFPISPSYYQSHSIQKEFYSPQNSIDIKTKIFPSITNNVVHFETAVQSTAKKYVAIELITDDFSYDHSSGETFIQTNGCKTYILTNGKFERFEKKLIWYTFTQNNINFKLQSDCSQ